MNSLKKKINPKKYILEILNLYPQILAGRKNILQYEERLKKNILITKKYFKQNKHE